jgi:hypothetical protein
MVRALAIAAILGGLLRVAGNFSQDFLSLHAAQISYAIEDVLLLLGLLGFALGLRAKGLGLAGITVAAAGLLTIRTGALTGRDLYVIGAGASLFGVAMLAVDILLRGTASRIAATLWLTAWALGLAALFPPLAQAATFAAALAFGSGFAAQGFTLLRGA